MCVSANIDAGHVPPHTARDRLNYFVVTDKTAKNECEAAFRRFAIRRDVVRGVSGVGGCVRVTNHASSRV